MSSSGKKKTTMAKRARENRLRERRLDKQARKDARKQASSAHLAASEDTIESEMGHLAPSDPREKEAALLRLRNAPDEQLEVFGKELRSDALEAGASEREMRDAQRDHPGHGA